MKIREAIENIREVHYPEGSPGVIDTILAEVFSNFTNVVMKTVPTLRSMQAAGRFFVAVGDACDVKELGVNGLKDRKDEVAFFKIQEDGSGCLFTSRSHMLYSFATFLCHDLASEDMNEYVKGKVFIPAFQWQRVSYDYFLTQEGRIQRGLDRSSYIRELARLGFTHVEVNGLAFPMGLETGPKGETYPMFYTYCPALDQFVSSSLNQGLYPEYYLSANLSQLKTNAESAVKYGLTPGLLCFEPRSVPERFFHRYPMLRGARVDHPFRSFKPRYNMTITHPLVQEHYREMMMKLMQEVPELGFLSIWTNDSGAGFEHTKSLYVGRNGGAYLIREWKSDEQIARLAGENALHFFRLLRDAARDMNPDFRVITRMESFYGEHDIVWKGLEDGVDVETASLIARGWDIPYHHPQYADSNAINPGTVYQNQFDNKERENIADLENRDARAHFYFAVGPHSMFEPLLGTPYPNLTFEKLTLLYKNGVNYLAHSGGTFPPEQVPFNVNHEVVRRFQWNPNADREETIKLIAHQWAGERFQHQLINAWELTEKAILAFPNITPLYSAFGFTWYRLWVRPFVPNIEKIPESQRTYYEHFMCTTHHNPNNVDLSRDVLFRLTTPEKSRRDVERIDQNVWKPLDEAIGILDDIREESIRHMGEGNIIHDQFVRLRALRCWLMTQRNVAAWIANVYGYMSSGRASEKEQHRILLKEMMEKEIENTRQLAGLLRSGIEFMAMTDLGETPLIHGSNLGDLLKKRIELMSNHMEDEPFIDPDYMMRRAGELIG